MKLYRYLFYGFYQFAVAMGNEGFNPEVIAWSLSTLFVWGNIVSTVILAKIFIPLSSEIFYTLLVSICIIWVIVSAINLMRIDGYKSFIKEIDKEPKTIKRKKTILVIIYCVATIAAFLYTTEL